MKDGDFVSWEDAVRWLKSQPDQQALVKACYYDDPLDAAAERYYRSSEWQAVQESLSAMPKGKVLDIGAGRGGASYGLAKDGWSVTALEPDPSAIIGAGAIRALAAESQLDIKVVEEWGERLPFADASFELVFCRQVLHHAADIGRFCREVSRVLKHGGRFMAIREHVISRYGDLETFRDNHPLHQLYGGENAFFLREYLGAIKSAGIRIQQVLNPYDSDINLYPDTRSVLKGCLAKKLFLPAGKFVPDLLLHWLGNRNRTPGRLYSFIGKKHE